MILECYSESVNPIITIAYPSESSKATLPGNGRLGRGIRPVNHRHALEVVIQTGKRPMYFLANKGVCG